MKTLDKTKSTDFLMKTQAEQQMKAAAKIEEKQPSLKQRIAMNRGDYSHLYSDEEKRFVEIEKLKSAYYNENGGTSFRNIAKITGLSDQDVATRMKILKIEIYRVKQWNGSYESQITGNEVVAIRNFTQPLPETLILPTSLTNPIDFSKAPKPTKEQIERVKNIKKPFVTSVYEKLSPVAQHLYKFQHAPAPVEKNTFEELLEKFHKK